MNKSASFSVSTPSFFSACCKKTTTTCEKKLGVEGDWEQLKVMSVYSWGGMNHIL